MRETIFNTWPKFTRATEPTNIIWENRHIKGINFGARLLGALLISIFMMSIAFPVIVAFKKAQIRNQRNWPSVNCEQLKKQYNSTGDYKSELLKFAGYEYDII